MKLSIIIPTKNRAELLDKMLDSLLQQTVSKEEFEVIVIDNGSIDSTQSICSSRKRDFPHFKYIFEKRTGLHFARNRGFLESKSKYLLFADDDVIGFPTWIEGIVEGLENENVALVGGNVIPKFEKEKPVWFKEFLIYRDNFHIMSQLSVIWTNVQENKFTNPLYIFGCNFGVKREVLENCGGFHPDGMPSNLLMYRGDGESYVSQFVGEHGLKAMFVPKASVYHMMPSERITVSYLKKRGKCDGISGIYTILRQKNTEDVIKCLAKNTIAYINSSGYKKGYYKAVIKGNLYLIMYYILYPQIREWVERKKYL
ncbi:MAG: glycosyltransferase family 2 protein [Suilimivivens sp.]